MTTDLLSKLTDDLKVKNEILAYAKNKFILHKDSNIEQQSSLSDEPFVETWHRYSEQAETSGVFEILQSHLVPLRFPIKKGISATDSYKSATLRGKNVNDIPEAEGLILHKPDELELKIHPSIGGSIPVLIVPDSEDFNTLIRALCHKNEPTSLPDSMGAAMINGINNWSKIKTLKSEFIANNQSSDWSHYFKNSIVPNKSLYQDKLIILSKKPYSSVSAEDLDQDIEDWEDISLRIRLEHECAHYYTLRHFGAMANNMHDELIADYAGICAGYGNYNPEWFLKFIGLEAYPLYRKGARLENYLGHPKLSNEAFIVLKTIIYKAVVNVKEFDSRINNRFLIASKKASLHSLCSFSLLQMAEEDGADQLYATYNSEIRKYVSSTRISL